MQNFVVWMLPECKKKISGVRSASEKQYFGPESIILFYNIFKTSLARKCVRRAIFWNVEYFFILQYFQKKKKNHRFPRSPWKTVKVLNFGWHCIHKYINIADLRLGNSKTKPVNTPTSPFWSQRCQNSRYFILKYS